MYERGARVVRLLHLPHLCFVFLLVVMMYNMKQRTSVMCVTHHVSFTNLNLVESHWLVKAVR